MPRFKWNDPKAGRLIITYVNTICREYPSLAKGIALHGIGPLGSWFKSGESSDFGCDIKQKPKCGCMVGTTVLVAMKQRPSLARLVLEEQLESFSDGPFILMNFILASRGRPVMRWYRDKNDLTPSEKKLHVCIEDSGMAAYDECSVPEGGDSLQRERHVITHIEGHFKKRLGLT